MGVNFNHRTEVSGPLVSYQEKMSMDREPLRERESDFSLGNLLPSSFDCIFKETHGGSERTKKEKTRDLKSNKNICTRQMVARRNIDITG